MTALVSTKEFTEFTEFTEERDMTHADDRAIHEPVHLDLALEMLRPGPESTLLDLTVGAGGHAEGLLEATSDGKLVGVDRDHQILEVARRRLACFGDRVSLLHGNFEGVGALCDGLGLAEVDGALIDLGVSSLQLDDPERGFSFDCDGPLDMRMDESARYTAADLINTGTRDELLMAIGTLGEERRARSIVEAILDVRRQAPLIRTCELADLVRRHVRGARHHHPATRTFMGLRMMVNDELGCVERGLPEVVRLLRTGARLMVIAFHGGEDRVVKQLFRALESQGIVRSLTRKPIEPEPAEIKRNPRARSARARVVERLQGGAGGH